MTKQNVHKTRRHGIGLLQWSLLLFFLILNLTDGADVNVIQQQKSEDDVVAASAESISVSGTTKRLDELSRRQLRGADTDPTATFLEVTDILESELENIKVVQKQMQSGDGATVAAVIGDVQLVSQVLSDHQEHDEDFASLDLSLTKHDARELQERVQTSTPDELASIAKQIDFTEAIEYFEQAVGTLKDAKASILALSSDKHQGHRRAAEYTGADFNFKGESSGSDFFKQSTDSKFNIPSSFIKKNGKRQFTFPKLRFAEKLRKQQEDSQHGHRRRRLSEDHPTCQARCDAKPDESSRFDCECERLFEFAGKLTPYDFAIMSLGGFIEEDPSADKFANFTVDDMADINVFDARDKILEKMTRVTEGVARERTRENCFAVLYELHTACDPNEDGGQTCTEPNTRTFQLSTDQVSEAVNTRTKLKIQPMGEFYDFRNWAVPQGKEYKKVFVTSKRWTGNLGGYSGADAKCKARANAANLGGTYYAWITGSYSDFSPSNRFERSNFLNSLPYYLVDGQTRVANNWGSLTSDDLLNPINMNENGQTMGSGRVWTNTRRDGTRRHNSGSTAGSCYDWKETYQGSLSYRGNIGSITSNWSVKGTSYCGKRSHLYCFQQDVSGSTELETEEVHWSTELAVQCCGDGNRGDNAEWMKSSVASCPWVLKQNDEDKCQYLSYEYAMGFCAKKGGRLCTKQELEKGCTNDAGCPFTSQLVWSSTETEPQCPATSLDTCRGFVQSFEKLYEGRPVRFLDESNPMKDDPDQAIDIGTLSNVDFPVDFSLTFPQRGGVEHGEGTIDGYIYAGGLSRDGDSFCGSTLGPPTALAKACDDSMDFLLGSYMSVGALTSIAEAVYEVNSGTPQPTPSPRWLTYYTRQTDTALIESTDEWTNWYQHITNDKDEPSWLGWYTEIRQNNGDRFTLPEYGSFYCEDTSIFEDGESIRNCQELWLNYKTENPYKSQYLSITYPDDPDLLPFNETSCDEYQTCQEGWVKEGASAKNPFDESGGCNHFWLYCRQLEPETVQCSRFFDDCRDKLKTEYPYWQYPQPPCIDNTIQADVIDTCPMEWLNDTVNPYTVETSEACYSFWETCRSDLNIRYPDVEYPVQYCGGNKTLTCQEEWLDDYKRGESNPYNPELESSCYAFWDSCYEKLRLEFPQWSGGWPLADPPTADDFMPGYCCLDTPANDDHFGYNYDPEQGMKCQARGPWYTGLSPEACSHANGHWFPTPCITLQRCIDARPLPDDPFFNPQFEDWVEAEEIEIYDASDEEQCNRARVALGYEADYLNDYHICETFDEFMCDNFFDDLEFLADGAASSEGASTGFDQIEFVPTTFPPDDPLKFDPLPKEETMKDMEPSDKAHLTALKWSKFSLETTKNNYKDFLEKIKSNTDSCQEIQPQLTPIVPGGPLVENPLRIVCRKTLKLTFDWVFSGLYIAIKIAYVGVSAAYYDNIIGPYAEIDGYEYSKAIYYNVKSSYKWNEKALDIINNNIHGNHLQMRSELQARHTDVANVVNEYTNCMSNHLGIQFFAEFRNTSAAPLSIRCRKVLNLGSNGRRLDDDTKLFNLGVQWGPDSMPNQVDKTLELEQEILLIENNILKKENEIMDNQVDMKNITRAMRDRMATLQETVNNIAKKLDMKPKSDAKSKKSKKAKAKAQQDSDTDEPLFHRNLLVEEAMIVKFDKMEQTIEAKVESMETQVQSIEGKVETIEGKVESIEGKVDNMESQVESIEGKVDSMESQIKSIEGKVDNMEKTMEEMKDMLSQLMMRGVADAEVLG